MLRRISAIVTFFVFLIILSASYIVANDPSWAILNYSISYLYWLISYEFRTNLHHILSHLPMKLSAIYFGFTTYVTRMGERSFDSLLFL